MRLKSNDPSSNGVKDCYLQIKMYKILEVFSPSKYMPGAIAFLSAISGLLLINGCQSTRSIKSKNLSFYEQEISRLQLRIEQLESHIRSTKFTQSSPNKTKKLLVTSNQSHFALGPRTIDLEFTGQMEAVAIYLALKSNQYWHVVKRLRSEIKAQ